MSWIAVIEIGAYLCGELSYPPVVMGRKSLGETDLRVTLRTLLISQELQEDPAISRDHPRNKTGLSAFPDFEKRL
jgi:hypothetical protein